ncbi:DNA helicase RecQ [Wenzhouxiangella sp. XN201]|nr:DNA helicase RecQ [Wenzhouxiangella sp. XN201]
MPGNPEDLLRQVFGYSAFRGRQREIIDHVGDGGHALVLMPTGGGKSLCYQVPALMRPGTAIVVSPLIALMRDQVEALRHNGVAAAVLNSSLDAETRRRTEQDLIEGRLDLLYIAPERLLRESTLRMFERCEINLLAIDEAHCVSQWGHDFRPEYLKLDVLARRFPQVPRIALTATADHRTRGEIVERLLGREARVFVDSFDRPNIRYTVGLKRNARQQLLSFIRRRHPGQSGIVYCFSRRKTEETAGFLVEQGLDALSYHAGMGSAERQAAQDRFINEDGLIICATIAFGMGIDKPDVRFVAHLDLPKSIESYYQETGRAGRDGLPADAWMVYSLADVVRIRQLLEQSNAGDEQKKLERERLEALLAYCEQAGCRRPALLGYFGENHPGNCGHCDNCQDPPETWDATEAARMALSCVYRTGQRFGAGHVIDVLTGKSTERAEQLGHDRLSTWAIGRDTDRSTWHSVLRQLLAAGYLVPDPEGHGGLRLGADCRALLRGETDIEMRRDAVPSSRKSRSKKAVDIDTESPLWQALRQWRLETARSEEVPPYVIFHDATLAAIVEARPQTLDELADISGVGEHKLARYGEAVIRTLDGADD